MAWLGVLMFAGALALMLATGLPVYAVLIGVAAAFAALGIALGAIDGTDRLVARGLATLAGEPRLLLVCVLGGFVACSFVLDAFEMVFLVVPLVMPPVLVAVPDPAWVAALTLLVLQAGFLLPPFGYAVVMARSTIAGAPGPRALGRVLLPHLALQAALVGAVLAWPQITRWTRPVEIAPPTAPAPDAERLLQQAIEAQQKDAAERAARP